MNMSDILVLAKRELEAKADAESSMTATLAEFQRIKSLYNSLGKNGVSTTCSVAVSILIVSGVERLCDDARIPFYQLCKEDANMCCTVASTYLELFELEMCR